MGMDGAESYDCPKGPGQAPTLLIGCWHAWMEPESLLNLQLSKSKLLDTTGNYREARNALMENRDIVADTVGLNWENVSKRIIPQLIYKGQVLQREDLCRTGLFFVCPKAVYDRVLNRLGEKNAFHAFQHNQLLSIFLPMTIWKQLVKERLLLLVSWRNTAQRFTKSKKPFLP